MALRLLLTTTSGPAPLSLLTKATGDTKTTKQNFVDDDKEGALGVVAVCHLRNEFTEWNANRQALAVADRVPFPVWIVQHIACLQTSAFDWKKLLVFGDVRISGFH
jgi:hypothetical protein